MKRTINNRIGLAGIILTAMLWSVAAMSNATPAMAQQMPNGIQQTQAGPDGPPGDPIRQLDLTSDQIAKIRSIREAAKDERFAINQRVRQAQLALDEAIEADNASEALVEQRARELAEAQAAVTRIRSITELRIRRVMTPEQLTKLRALRQQAQQFREERRQLPGQMRRDQRMQRRPDALQDGPRRPVPLSPRQGGTLPQKPRP
jgi:Spy/CpxP family protein refolding chaperone